MEDQITKALKIESKLENINVIEDLINEVCEKYKIEEDQYGNVLISMTEAVTNAIIHGNKSNPAKFVDVSYSIEDDSLKFTVKDEGTGFDYNNLPDPTAPENIEKPTGRGIFLMKSLADSVDFHDNGRIVELSFFL
jgi:serine/threonine-protein kinase RsbW